MKFTATTLSGLLLAGSVMAQEYQAVEITAPQTVTANQNFSVTLTFNVSLIDDCCYNPNFVDNVSVGYIELN